MVYEVFLDTVKEHMSLALGRDYNLSLHKVPKNNGLILDGLCISRGNDSIAPAIYLNACYEQYRRGKSLEQITEELLALYHENEVPSNISCEQLSDFSAMKPKISMRLINRESNRLLLEQIPHIPWLDLEIVFHLSLQEDDSGLMTALIHNEHLSIWNTTARGLYQLASANAPRLFPPVISSMSCILENLMEEAGASPDILSSSGLIPDDPAETPFYVLTNTCGIHGAACMLYDHVLQHFSEGTESDLIILPSSIHEVLLLPDEGDISYEEMSRLVTEINCSEVAREDRLSNQVYLYSRNTETVTLASSNHSSIS